MVGRIEVVAGPMFSGKNAELLRRLETEIVGKRKVVLLKPQLDDNQEDTLMVEKIRNTQCPIKMLPTQGDNREIKYYLKLLEEYDVIGIDAVQFFELWMIYLCEELRNAGKRVIACGLDMDYMGKPFGEIGDLIAIANEVQKSTAVCMICGERATYTQRLVDRQPVTDGNPLQTGTSECYEARCQKCFIKQKIDLSSKDYKWIIRR